MATPTYQEIVEKYPSIAFMEPADQILLVRIVRAVYIQGQLDATNEDLKRIEGGHDQAQKA